MSSDLACELMTVFGNVQDSAAASAVFMLCEADVREQSHTLMLCYVLFVCYYRHYFNCFGMLVFHIIFVYFFVSCKLLVVVVSYLYICIGRGCLVGDCVAE